VHHGERARSDLKPCRINNDEQFGNEVKTGGLVGQVIVLDVPGLLDL
jgi:hypothetical protein